MKSIDAFDFNELFQSTKRYQLSIFLLFSTKENEKLIADIYYLIENLQ